MSDWYYAVDNEQKGPINESELKENLAGNKLAADTLVWKDGMDNWTPANQVPAFSFRQPPIPAKVQPPATGATRAITNNPVATESPAPISNPESTQPVTMASVMGKPEALEVDAEDAEANKAFGIMAYVPVPIPVWWLLGIVCVKDSPFTKYHVNQGLVLGVVWFALVIALWIIGIFFSFLPSVLYIIFTILRLVYVGPLILSIMGIINAAAGKCVPLPLIGGIKLYK